MTEERLREIMADGTGLSVDDEFIDQQLTEVKRIRSRLSPETELLFCYKLWLAWSIDMCAGWLLLPEKDADLSLSVAHALQHWYTLSAKEQQEILE